MKGNTHKTKVNAAYCFPSETLNCREGIIVLNSGHYKVGGRGGVGGGALSVAFSRLQKNYPRGGSYSVILQ